MSYLVKTKSETLLFFYDEKCGICYRNELEDAVNQLTDEADGVMDVCAGNDDLHLVCQSKKGELLYFCYRAGQWHRTVLLNSKREEPSFFCVRLNVRQDELRIIYGLEHQGKNLIVFQLLEHPPVVLAETSEKTFLLREDSAGCLYLIYRFREETQMQCYRYGNWSRPESFGNIKVNDALFQHNQTGYLAFTEQETIFYAFVKAGKIEEKIQVAKAGKQPVLMEYQDAVWILYENRERIFYWKKGEKNPAAMITGVQPELFRIRTAEGREPMRLAYGSRYRNRVNLFLCSEIPRAKPISFSEQAMIELTKLKLRMDALEETVRKWKPVVSAEQKSEN